ncbi:bifunctional methylenetetrahydrofolate dehydrogenase/methenyltetrahydrofolate cyclohydrolase FolD [Paraburkholderia sacchari]|uniref:bifunctional methylenetetrahydrofolate dehydrogenase/methenyltetrahydrofolate cyclohydrolase FolD n=1 Tax=Paraburkholderia sacchari TaxID=159450 RepID=UPI003D994EFB
MTAQLINGLALAHRLRATMRERAEKLSQAGYRAGLAVVLVGDDPASAVYVRNKLRACEECGVGSQSYILPGYATEGEVLDLIDRLNADDSVHGILVQLPLPPHINVRRVIESIDVCKDVDGFHLYNVGALVLGQSVFPPCTPYGVQLLLETTGIEVAGKNAVVVGASNIVGKPMALMLLQKEATVSICHVRTRDLAQFTILADILIVAAGKPGLITGPMVKQGAVVIDVGINRLPNGNIVGDVDFESVRERAAWLTPVPGGVGPMTVTMLIENTLRSAERVAGLAVT